MIQYYLTHSTVLAVGVENEFYFSIYWEKSSQLTLIFFRGIETTNQCSYKPAPYETPPFFSIQPGASSH